MKHQATGRVCTAPGVDPRSLACDNCPVLKPELADRAPCNECGNCGDWYRPHRASDPCPGRQVAKLAALLFACVSLLPAQICIWQGGVGPYCLPSYFLPAYPQGSVSVIEGQVRYPQPPFSITFSCGFLPAGVTCANPLPIPAGVPGGTVIRMWAVPFQGPNSNTSLLWVSDGCWASQVGICPQYCPTTDATCYQSPTGPPPGSYAVGTYTVGWRLAGQWIGVPQAPALPQIIQSGCNPGVTLSIGASVTVTQQTVSVTCS